VSAKPSQALSVVQFLNTSNSEMSVISVIEYGINVVWKSGEEQYFSSNRWVSHMFQYNR
jgi:hypothetical protein